MRRRFLVGLVVVYAALMAALVLGPQVLAERSRAVASTCTGTVAGATMSDVTVPEGAVCRIRDSSVQGSVTVERDAYFEASGTRISGDVRAERGLTVFLHDGTAVSGSVVVDAEPQLFLYKTTVGGTVKVTAAVAPGFGHVQICETDAGQIDVRGSGPDVLIGDPQGGCLGNRLKANLIVAGNNTTGELVVSGNMIFGSLVVIDNSGPSPKDVLDNTVRGTLELANNAVPFDSSSSTR